MISMYTRQEIILKYHVEGKSGRAISRALCISRKTVQNVINEYQASLSESGDIKEALHASLREEKPYDSSNRGKKKLTEEITVVIDDLLAQNVKKRATGLQKQVLKKQDIHILLQEQGFDIGYTSVCGYIKNKSNQVAKEVFIRQSYTPGSSCEYDWAEVKLEISGKQQKFQLAVFTSSYSNYRYAMLYSKQDTLSFMEAHVGFISHCGGAFKEMVYDNMRVAVAKFVGKHEKEPTRALLDLRGYYQFSHRFCNAYKGNEKGHVERSVEYVRRKSFGYKHEFDSIEDASVYLYGVIDRINDTQQQLTGKTANELFEEEKSLLRPCSHPMECSHMETLRVDKYATISLKTNRYSVPEKLVGEFVEVKVYSSKIVIFHHNIRQGSHLRSYGKHQWIIQIEHYLETFKAKPGALANSSALISNGYLKTIYDQYFHQQPRAFVDLLQYCYTKQVDQARLSLTINKLLSHHDGFQVNIEAVMALLGNHDDLDIIRPSQKSSEIQAISKQHLQEMAKLLSN